MSGAELEPIVEELAAEAGLAGSGSGVSPGQLRLFELKEGLPTLLKLSLTFAAIGLVALVTAFIEFMQAILHRTVGKLPGVGGLIDGATRWAQQVFTHKLASLYSGTDHYIGHSFFQLARLGRLLGRVVLTTAYTTVAIANTLKRYALQQPLGPVVGKLGKQAKGVASRVTGVEKKVVQVTKVVTRPGTVIPLRRVHALETEVKRLQAQQAVLQKQVAAKAHPSSLATAAEVTALGLAGLGASWIRCEGSRSLGKGACNMGPNGVEKWLAGLALIGLTFTLEELAVVGRTVIAEGESLVKQFA